MSTFTLKNARIYNGPYDHSGQVNRVDVSAEAAAQDGTTFLNAGAKVNLPGILSATVHVEGFYDSTSIANDTYLFNEAFQTQGVPFSIYGQGSAEGAKGYASSVMQTKYSPKFKVGDLAVFSIDAKGSGSALVRVTSMFPPNTAVSGSAPGNAFQISSVSGNQFLHSFLHVLTMGGSNPAVTVSISSAPAAVGPWTYRITHSTFTAIGAEHKQLVGPVTDTYYRISWTCTGTGASSIIQVGVGVQ